MVTGRPGSRTPPRTRDGGLGGAVRVQHAAPRRPALHQFGRARLSAHHEGANGGDGAIDRGEHGGHAVQHRDVVVFEEFGEPLADPAPVVRARDERGPDRPGRPDLLDGEVERDRHALVDAVGGHHAVDLGDHLQEVADARLGRVDALGAAARAGGVDDVRARVAGEVEFDSLRGHLLDLRQRLVDDEELDLEGLHDRQLLGSRDQQVECGVGGHVLDTVGGRARVDRHESRTGLHGTEQRGVHQVRTRQEQAHPGLLPDTLIAQEVRQPVRRRIQLCVGGLAALPFEGGGLGCRIARRLEVVVHAEL